jgi:hypothetical protein
VALGSSARERTDGPPEGGPWIIGPASGLSDRTPTAQELIEDDEDRHDQKHMDNAASDVPEQAKQPEHHQNDNYRPNHAVSPS